MDFVDRTLKCIQCGKEFVFTAGEQLFFHDKQFNNDPKRCKECKAKRSTEKRDGRRGSIETRTQCSECGVETTVPFRPTQGRPVLCRSCFQLRQGGAAVPHAGTPADGAQGEAESCAAVGDAVVEAAQEPGSETATSD